MEGQSRRKRARRANRSRTGRRETSSPTVSGDGFTTDSSSLGGVRTPTQVARSRVARNARTRRRVQRRTQPTVQNTVVPNVMQAAAAATITSARMDV